MLTKKEKEAYELENPSKFQTIKGIEDIVLVHVTNYLPKEGIIKSPKDAGVKYEEEFDGVKYEVPRQRRTVHFAMNGEVSNNIGGSWDDRKYAIIIPLENVEKEDFIEGTPTDFYSNKSVKIPKGSYVLCTEAEREKVQREMGKDISVIGVEEENVIGYANCLIEKLGYKRETIGDYNWSNINDNNIAKEIIENNWRGNIHSHSTEMSREMIEEDIIRCANIVKIMKEKGIPKNSPKDNIFSKHGHMMNTPNIFLDPQYLEQFCKELKSVAGIEIPQTVKEEVLTIKESGNLSEEEKMELSGDSKFKAISESINAWDIQDKNGNLKYKKEEVAELILRRRIIGEIGLSQTQEKIEENHEINFEELCESFDNNLYEYTTEERRNEFLESQGIELSDVEKKIINSQELNNLYQGINQIKDTPYGELEQDEKQKVENFKAFYEKGFLNHFDGYRLSKGYKYDEKWNILGRRYISLNKNDFKEFSKEDLSILGSEYIGNDGNEKVLLNFRIDISDETTLTQYLNNYEGYINKLEGLLKEKNKNKIEEKDKVSVEKLGKETLEEQKDTKAKMNMQQKIEQKIKEYTISQEKGVEK